MHFVHQQTVSTDLSVPSNFYLSADKFDADDHSTCTAFSGEIDESGPDQARVGSSSGPLSPKHAPRRPHRLVGESLGWATNFLRLPETPAEIDDSGSVTINRLHGHDCAKEACERVIINVSGMRFETQLKTLNRLPHTLLGDPVKRKKYWDEEREEFFFDRHRPTFQAVLYYYQSGGRLKRPFEVPADVFLDELTFYELGGSVMDSFKRNECHLGEEPEETQGSGWKQVLWDTLETPDSSWLAKIVVLTSVLVIITSVGSFCLETLPQFDYLQCLNVSVPQKTSLSGSSSSGHNNGSTNNSTTNQHNKSGLTDEETGYQLKPNYANPFYIIECCCIGWFTVEYVLRLIACSSKPKFLKDFMNFVDLLAIIPFFVTLAIALATDKCVGKGGGALSILRVLRVLRVFKLGKHSQGLQILGKTITTSVKDLTMFALFLIVAIVIFSSAMYYAENGINPTRFASIPDSFWYSLVTITTVGYGEVYPISVLGKIIGSVCVLAGVLTIALPVPIIVTNFNKYYTHATGRGR